MTKDKLELRAGRMLSGNLAAAAKEKREEYRLERERERLARERRKQGAQRGPFDVRDGKARKVAIYTRVSTPKPDPAALTFDQRPEIQELPIRQMCERNGWDVYKVYSDRVDGTKQNRPGLDAMMAEVETHMFDTVAVWRFDRLARNLKHLLAIKDKLDEWSVDLISHQEGLDTSTPMGICLFSIIGSIAQLERDLISQRVQSGMDYAKENGTRSGKPIGRPKTVTVDVGEVRLLRRQGLPWREVKKQMGQSYSSIRRAVFLAEKRGE